ncbi:EmrB/QacA subfamily drug resistance transporter [Actinoplanes lutulentus]|uniref:EmrB/QacA subfamily drug resistance transporter n=1 Tax=Actinoplanes lutulentus TaxID=1287878 RepID=A0A327ZE95_9ACTN|nr:MFS transporter [Actinoplanes lutulentus]MBB2941655.1 EmrB/QacA subfamily drug resistance transporter [Actinoplanes lutulentus]RAK39575.1 EmrB/QacA subfamily drug resistance transporter [Actinoplanes lutulentus]
MSSRGATLAVLNTVSLMIVLDSTIVAVAIPAIQQDLGFSPAGVAWVINGYLVAFGGLLLLAGRLGDLIGSRRVFLAGLALFTVASLLCGFAPTAELLIAGRFLQGAGGAFASAVILGMIVRLYPAPGPQARAMGIFSFTQAGGAAIGFVVGGVLTDLAGWPAIFLINVPIGIAAFIFGLRLLPVSVLVVGGGLDIPGALLITAGLSAGVYAIVDGLILVGALALLLLIAFLVRQKYAPSPLIPLRLLRRPWLLAANSAVLLIVAAGLGFQFVNTLFLQKVLGFDALRTGLAFLPTPLMIGLVSLLVAARLTSRFGVRPVLLGGLTLVAGGLVMLSQAPSSPVYAWHVLPALVVMGLGIGVAVPAVMMLSMAGSSEEDTGLVSGLNNTAQQAGMALGLAVLAAVSAGRTSGLVADGVSAETALREGYSLAFLLAAGFVAAAFVVTVTALRTPPAAPVVGPGSIVGSKLSAP